MGEAEVELAVEALRAALREAGAPDDGSGLVALPPPAYENRLLPMSADAFGLEGARAELLELEGVLLPGLRKHIPGWERSGRESPISKLLNKGKKEEAEGEEAPEQESRRAEWLRATEQATGASELGKQLLALEETIRPLQRAADVSENKPWRT